MTQNKQQTNEDVEEGQPFLSHLIELRGRLLRGVLAILIAFLCLFPFSNHIYSFIAKPMLDALPSGQQMMAIDIASPFLTPFKLTMMAAIFLAIPVILYQAWSFIAPGLYLKEKKLAVPLMVSSTFLFYLGTAFAYYVVFPIIFEFFISVAPEGVTVSPDIARYLDFLLVLFFAFGIAFEVPIATILLVATGMTTADSLAAKRPYIIVGAFAVGMLLTPPDVISQTLLAIPMWILYEIGLLMSRLIMSRRKREEAASS